MFPLAARYNCPKFGLDPRGDSAFPNAYLMTGSKNVTLAVLFSLFEIWAQFSECPRVPPWQHYLISLIGPQKQYPIIKNYVA